MIISKCYRVDEERRNYDCDYYYNNQRCGKEPAWVNIADCCGDSDGPYCREHWIKWFNEEFLPQLVIEENE